MPEDDVSEPTGEAEEAEETESERTVLFVESMFVWVGVVDVWCFCDLSFVCV